MESRRYDELTDEELYNVIADIKHEVEYYENNVKKRLRRWIIPPSGYHR